MKSFGVLFCFGAMLAMTCASTVQASTRVAESGETRVAATSRKLKVQVQLKTHEVQINQPNGGKLAGIEMNCTYSRFPCSIVDMVQITVNNHPLYVPRSAFCDLADLNTAEVQANEKESILTLRGGDASEAYIVKIEFDETHVERRTLSSEMSPDQPLQQTIYYVVVVGN